MCFLLHAMLVLAPPANLTHPQESMRRIGSAMGSAANSETKWPRPSLTLSAEASEDSDAPRGSSARGGVARQLGKGRGGDAKKGSASEDSDSAPERPQPRAHRKDRRPHGDGRRESRGDRGRVPAPAEDSSDERADGVKRRGRTAADQDRKKGRRTHKDRPTDRHEREVAAPDTDSDAPARERASGRRGSRRGTQDRARRSTPPERARGSNRGSDDEGDGWPDVRAGDVSEEDFEADRRATEKRKRESRAAAAAAAAAAASDASSTDSNAESIDQRYKIYSLYRLPTQSSYNNSVAGRGPLPPAVSRSM